MNRHRRLHQSSRCPYSNRCFGKSEMNLHRRLDPSSSNNNSSCITCNLRLVWDTRAPSVMAALCRHNHPTRSSSSQRRDRVMATISWGNTKAVRADSVVVCSQTTRRHLLRNNKTVVLLPRTHNRLCTVVNNPNNTNIDQMLLRSITHSSSSSGTHQVRITWTISNSSLRHPLCVAHV